MNEMFTLVIVCGVLALLYGVLAARSVLAADAGNEKMQEIAAAIPDGLAELRIFKGCGHGVERDDKGAALKAIREFILA